MVFWKSLFSGGDTATEPISAAIGQIQVTGINLPPSTQIFLSTDLDLDFYEF